MLLIESVLHVLSLDLISSISTYNILLIEGVLHVLSFTNIECVLANVVCYISLSALNNMDRLTFRSICFIVPH